MPNKDEVFAVLTRSNKLFNRERVRFAASGGKITLNGVPVDILDFGNLPKPDQSNFLINLQTPIQEVASSGDVSMMQVLTQHIFQADNIKYFQQILEVPNNSFSALLVQFSVPIRKQIIKMLKKLLNLAEIKNIDFYTILSKICPEVPCLEIILRLILKYFGDKAIEYLRRERNNEARDCTTSILEFVITSLCSGKDTEGIVGDLLDHCIKCTADMLYCYEKNKEDVENKVEHELSANLRNTIKCKVCGGSYFSK